LSERTILITGIAGNLGRRLLPLLSDFEVIGVDFKPPKRTPPARFATIDLGEEASCRALIELIQETRPASVVHLAFVTDPVTTGVLDRERMWQINIAGTARVLEAVAGVNRMSPTVQRFIYPSSASVYGPETPGPVDETFPLGAHTLTYAVHKKECEVVLQRRISSLGDCNTYILRPHIYTGASMHNYLVDVLRGTAFGRGWMGRFMRKRGWRLPLLLPLGRRYPQKLLQCVHVDDVARVIEYMLRQPYQKDLAAQVLNVAGSGRPLSIAECADIAHARMMRLPFRFLCWQVLKFLWSTRAYAVPAEAYPYMIGSYTVNTEKLRTFLGADYDRVIRYSVEAALRDSFQAETATGTQN